MIRFSLFGVPVSISPTLWPMLAVLGWCFAIPSAPLVPSISLFMVVAFICVLSHELGHALVGRWLGGGNPQIFMTWLGGDYCNQTARLTRTQGIIMSAAGPLASLSLILLPLLCFAATGLGCEQALACVGNFIIGRIPGELLMVYPPMAVLFAVYLVQVSFWWALINVLPVFPLDGGLIMYGLTRSTRLMHTVSVAVAGVFATFFLALGSWLIVLLLLCLALFNYRCLQGATE